MLFAAIPPTPDLNVPFGNSQLMNQLTPDQMNQLAHFIPSMARAVQQAEGDPTGNMGVRSIKNPKKPKDILLNSIANNYARWQTNQPPAPWLSQVPNEMFVDFMQRRWAPIGAKNDPTNLNKNWAPNVKQILGDKAF